MVNNKSSPCDSIGIAFAALLYLAEGRKMKMLRDKKGFTLIELMIVVVIIGILAAMAIPRFMQATVKSKQTEAKLVLKQIYTMQMAYRQLNDTYYPGGGNTIMAQAGGAFPSLHVEIMTPAYYSYSVTGDITTFSATAGSNGATGLDDDPALDVWMIDQTGNLVCITDDSSS
jgi:prepilin-type N-terminal cleavage/methylation domain-containing protein